MQVEKYTNAIQRELTLYFISQVSSRHQIEAQLDCGAHPGERR